MVEFTKEKPKLGKTVLPGERVQVVASIRQILEIRPATEHGLPPTRHCPSS